MKILIIGGTGLISTQITEQLPARGDDVWHFNRGQPTVEEFLTWNQHHQTAAWAIGAPEPTPVHIPTAILAQLLPSQNLADPAHWTLTHFQFNNIFDNTAARRDLSFRYTIRWEEGTKRMADWPDTQGSVANSDNDPLDDRLIAAWERTWAHLQRDDVAANDRM